MRKENRELALANAILSDAAAFRGGARPPIKVATFAAAHRHYEAMPICQVLQAAPVRAAR